MQSAMQDVADVLGRLGVANTREKRALALAVVTGGAAGLHVLRGALAAARREQATLCQGLESNARRMRAPKVAVDALFAKRLAKILGICLPSPWSAEAALVASQGVLLVSRTLLTDLVSRLEGAAGRNVIQGNFQGLVRVMALFCATAVPATLVNAGLKYMQKRIKLAFMRRLSHHLHELYCSHRAYYAASTLGGLTAADQRLTEDVERFAFSVSELYSYTFKPALDVVLFTRSLSRIMGYKGQLGLYAYYLACALMLRAASPPLALMTAQETALAGQFRAAHQRLANHAEEVAFNDPPAGTTERMILNQHLYRLLRHSRLSAFQHFVQQCLDGYFIKYGATVVALAVYAAPVWAAQRAAGPGGARGQGEQTADYIRAMRLLNNTSRGIGDLVLAYKRVTSLAGHTSRVSELLEQVKTLSGDDAEAVRTQLFLKNVSSTHQLALEQPAGGVAPPPEPARREGEEVAFHRVYLSSPDGAPLVRELSFEVAQGRSVIIMGPNGSGKSSLFRVAAGLWPLQAGEVVLPPKGELFYLSQRPYLVSGTLRDQLLYPEPPRSVLATAGAATRARVLPWMRSVSMGLSKDELEERLCDCLEAVELDYLLGRGRGWDAVQNWNETLSGGEKQRLAMARLLFHHPRYAVLDECTSAVSADGERQLYAACVRAGITMLSIGHRPALRQFHSTAVHFDGCGGFSIEQLRASDREGLAEALAGAGGENGHQR